jgi:glutathione peroxidase
MPGIYDFTANSLAGEEVPLKRFEGRVLLIVNTASACGFTPQYRGLEALQQQYAPRGFAVLGFPCNQFGAQEPGTEADIKQFCSTKYDVDFPMFAKVDVNGEARHPLYAWLTSESTAPDGPGDVQWNFAKFVIDKNGDIVARFSPKTEPEDSDLRKAVEKAIG